MTPLRPAYKPQEAAKILGRSKAWIIEKAPTDLGRAMGAHRTPTEDGQGHWLFDPERFEKYVRDLRAGKTPGVPKKRRKVKSGGPRQPRSVAMNEWLDGFRKAG